MICPDIILKKIGTIRTPYKDVSSDVPIQGQFHPGSEGYIELLPGYHDACRDLDGFSHIILVYRFHLCTEEKTIARPYMDTEQRGIFSTRFPHRPNHIGISLVEVICINAGLISVRVVDMVDGTPLLDIKPYVPRFDSVASGKTIKTGWMTPYLSGQSEPSTTRTRSENEWSRNHR